MGEADDGAEEWDALDAEVMLWATDADEWIDEGEDP